MRLYWPLFLFNIIVPIGLFFCTYTLLSNIGSPLRGKLADVDERCRTLGMVDLRASLVADWGREQTLPVLQNLMGLYTLSRDQGWICHSPGLIAWREDDWGYTHHVLGFNDTSIGITECSSSSGAEILQLVYKGWTKVPAKLEGGLFTIGEPGSYFGDLQVCYAFRHLELLKLEAKLLVLAAFAGGWLCSLIVLASRKSV